VVITELRWVCAALEEWIVAFYDTYGEELGDVYGFFVELILETEFCFQKTR
jgi:hypothetical protein